MRNETVVENWVNGKIGHSLTMQTDGKSIFSYEMKIGQTLINGEKQGLNVQKPFFYSQTTSKHVGIVKRCADNMVNPVSIKRGYSLWYLFP